MQKRRYHDFRSKFFCLTVPKHFVGEHFGVSENFGYRKILCIREEGYHVSPSKTFCHIVPKNFVGKHFGVSENFVYRKILCIKRGSLNCVENFLSHSADKIRRRTLLCFERILVSKIFKQRSGKLHVEEPFCVVFQKISGSQKVYG